MFVLSLGDPPAHKNQNQLYKEFRGKTIVRTDEIFSAELAERSLHVNNLEIELAVLASAVIDVQLRI